MKKIYTTPNTDILVLTPTDVIASSGGLTGKSSGEGGTVSFGDGAGWLQI